MRAISLFSGAGGFEIGFERAGIQTVLQAESDPWCRQVLERHWPEVERVTDVRHVTQQTVCEVDLVYGGWPCQGNSVAGKRAGLSDERSGLWHEVRRVLRELRPRWFVGENVPGLLSVSRGADFLRVLMDLEHLGYGWAYRVLDARWFGVPQRRRRVFIIGCLGNETSAAAVLAVCESCGGHPAPRQEAREGLAYSLSASVRGTGDGHGNAWNSNYVTGVAGTLGSVHHGIEAQQAWTNRLVVANGLPVAGAQTVGHSSPRDDGADNLVTAVMEDQRTGAIYEMPHTHALSSTGGGKPGQGYQAIHGPMGVRRLTPLECERLMGWPDDFTRWTADGHEIPDSHRYRLCGNGVVSTVAEYIGHRLVAVDSMREAHAERCSNA